MRLYHARYAQQHRVPKPGTDINDRVASRDVTPGLAALTLTCIKRATAARNGPSDLHAGETTGTICFWGNIPLYLCLIMDFDANTAARGSGDVTDETRLSAATKRVTLTPLHEDVQPELKADGSAGGESGVDVPLANVPSDMESTSTAAAQPETSAPAPLSTPVGQVQPAATPAETPVASISQAPAASFLPAVEPVKKSNKLPLIAIGAIVAVVVIGAAVYFASL